MNSAWFLQDVSSRLRFCALNHHHCIIETTWRILNSAVDRTRMALNMRMLFGAKGGYCAFIQDPEIDMHIDEVIGPHQHDANVLMACSSSRTFGPRIVDAW